MPTADKFASEWQPILIVSQSTLEAAFDEFVTIPGKRCLQRIDNMEEFSKIEVLEVIGDGLNNDFFKDAQVAMVPAIMAMVKELLKGNKPPESLLEGLIIPLRKKRDSDNAMDLPANRAPADGI